MRNTVVLLIVGAALLVVLAVFVLLLGPPRGGGETTSGDSTAASAGRSNGEGGSTPAGFDDPATHADSAAVGHAGTPSGGDPASADLVGTSVAGMDSPPRKHTGHGLDEADELPMAKKGLDLGIDTSLDDDWTPRNEAEQWFEPLHGAFEAARPLTPDVYNAILGENRETTVDVLKRAGEIGDVLGADRGLAFLDAWNALMDPYKVEAYGR
jgi:hypothetical protein